MITIVEEYDAVAAELEQLLRQTFPRTKVARYRDITPIGNLSVAFLEAWYIVIRTDTTHFTKKLTLRELTDAFSLKRLADHIICQATEDLAHV